MLLSEKFSPPTTPRRAARRAAMLNAARDLFAEQGFSGTTLSDILKVSGGSRTSLYEFFGDKHGLLLAVLDDSSSYIQPVFAALESQALQNAPIRESLISFSIDFLQAVLSPPLLATGRILHSEGHRFPHIGREFMNLGPNLSWQYLAHYFERKLPQIDKPMQLAHMFLGAIQGEFMLMCRAGLRSDIRDEDIRDHVEMAVTLLMKAVDFDPSTES